MSEEGAVGFPGTITEQSVVLSRVWRADLEMLRQHRNEPETRKNLRYAGEVSEEQQEKWFASEASSKVMVAMIDGVAVGIARVDGQYVGVDVFSAHRSKGYALPIFQAACRLAESRGNKKLALWVFYCNKRAISTYLKCGFSWDENEPVKWFIRDGIPQAYAKMIRGENSGA